VSAVELPRVVVWLLESVLPDRAAATVLTDLDDEYAAVRRTRPALPAAYWLVRETSSLVAAYAVAPLARTKGRIPMWLRDARLVLRGLRRRPLAALGAAAMLSSGLLAVLVTTGMSSVLLFRPISAVHGEALRRVAAVDRRGGTSFRLSYAEFQVVRERLSESATLTAVNLQPVLLRAGNVDVQTMAEVVDGRYFTLTGMTARLGRGLIAGDDRPDGPRVAVIAEIFWRRRFSASPDVVGQSISLNGESYTVVGVASALGSSSFLGASVDAWVPVAHADPLLNRGWRTDVTNRWWTAYALPVSASAEVDARLTAAAADLARLYPDQWRERRLHTVPGTVLVGAQRSTVTMLATILAGFAVLILAVAAANVGGLLLARAAADRRHAAIHLSLGSGRGAVGRRLMIEGAALGIAGGCVALAMYVWARTWFEEITVLPTLALRLSLPLDAGVSALVLGAGLGTGLLLAIGPATWASRLDLAGALRDQGPRSSGGRGLARTRHILVSAQVCLSLALVVGAALFTRSLEALATVDVGFPRDHLVAMDFDVEPSQPAMSELPPLAREALTRVSQLPGIINAAMSNRAPIDQSTPSIEVRASAAHTATVGDVGFYLATEGYFDTVGLPLVAGRAFTATEAHSNAAVAIVNETLADRLWPRGDAIDRPLYLVADARTVRVVGVARNSKYRTLSESPRPHLYRPTAPTLGLTLLARTSADPYQALGEIQRALDGISPGLVGFFPRTLDDHLAIDVLPTRAAARAATGLGTLALVLSASGLYGLVAWFVELRRREIGIRMALGATAANVRLLIVRQALGMAIPGIAAGLVLASILAVVARSALFGVQPLDPVALGAGVAALAIVVVSASYVPSRRATLVDPAIALRQP
jgi:predicted permease